MSADSDFVNTAVPIVMVCLLVLGVISSWFWTQSRSEALIRQWAAENRCEIIAMELRSFFRGPFFLTSGKGQTVYYVTVRDTSGVVRRAWVRCGGYFFGLSSNAAEARWE